MNQKSVLPFLLILSTSLLVSPGRLFPQQESPPSNLTREQQEEFLLTARIVRIRNIPEGVTDPQRATLSDGRITHDAHVQTVDIRTSVYTTSKGREFNFTDSYKYNIAGYRLDRLLGLGMVPVSVERNVGGNSAAVTWWIDDMLMTDGERKKRKIPIPNPDHWNKQMYRVFVFDQLIYNTDRNSGNLVITRDWRIHMIDHTRAFRTHRVLKSPKDLVQCDRRLLAALRGLTYETLAGELRPYLNKRQIKALLARRDLIVKYFDNAVAEKGEQAMLYDLPPRQ